MTVPTHPSLVQTGRTPNELQDLMASNESQVEGADTTAYSTGGILPQHLYQAHNQLANNAYVPPHAWAQIIPSELAMGYAPSNAASGPNHPGNAFRAYPSTHTMPATIPIQASMTHAPFNFASGSNHVLNTMNTTYHQPAGSEFTPPHRYEPQANQSLTLMGMNYVPRHFPHPATLHRPTYAQIYYPGATRNPAAEAFHTQSVNPFVGHVDQFSHPGFEDRSFAQGVPAFSPSTEHAPVTGYPGGLVNTYGVGQRDADPQASTSNLDENTGDGAEISQQNHLLDAFLNARANPDWNLISILNAEIGQPSNAHTDEHTSGAGDQVNSDGEGHQDSLPQSSTSNDLPTGDGSGSTQQDRDFDVFFSEISNFDRDFELNPSSDAQTEEQPNVQTGELVSQVNDINEPRSFSDEGDSGEKTEVADVPQTGVEPELNMPFGENWNFDIDLGFLDLPAWPDSATFGAQIHSTDEEAGAVHNSEPADFNNNDDGSRNVEEQTDSQTPTQNERLDDITNLSVGTQSAAPDHDTSIASASGGKGKKRAIDNVDFDEEAHEEWNFDIDLGFLDLPAWPENATFGAQIPGHSTDEEAGGNNGTALAVYNSETGHTNNNDDRRNVEEETDSQKLTQKENLNLSVSTKSAAPDLETSIASASGKGKKRAIDFDEEEHEEYQYSPRKRSSTEHMDESSTASHHAAVPSGSSTPTANANNSTPTTPTAGPSNWQAEASPAAHSIKTPTVRAAAKPRAQSRTKKPTEPLRCDICVAAANGRRVATYQRPAELNRHVRQKHIIGKLSCLHCTFKVSNDYALRRHILKVHGLA